MQYRRQLSCCFVAVMLCLPMLIKAQLDTAKPKMTPFLEQMDLQLKGKNSKRVDTAFSRAFDKLSKEKMLADLGVDLAEYKYRKATWDYYVNDLTYRRNVFSWQHDSARMTFAIAILIVLCGLLFSGIQFRIAMKQATLRIEQLSYLARKKAEAIDTSSPAAQTPDKLDDILATNLKLSTQGVEVSSSILGVIILVLSLAFFYLYLVYVFPIKETNFDLSGLKTEQQEINDSTRTK